MATIEQLSTALINADKAGDADAARALAAEIGRMRATEPTQPAQPAPVPPQATANTDLAGSIDAFGRGAANMAGMGFMDEIGAGADYLGSHILPWRTAKTYDEALHDTRTDDARVASEHPIANAAGTAAGVVGSASGLARAGLSPTVNAIQAGKGLLGVTKASAKEGLALGLLQGFGNGEGVENRLYNAGVGGLEGAGLGMVLPGAINVVGSAARAATQPITSMFRPGQAADRAMGTYLSRSGMAADDIANQIRGAQAEGQDMYTVADAMGHAGQRALVPAVRTPNNARQEITNALLGRQASQGDRLSNYLAEGFAAPDTAAQRASRLTAERTATGNTNYAAARQGAGPVNLNGAIDEIDSLLGRDPILGETALSSGPLGQRLGSLRDQLRRGGEQLIDFDRVLNIKSDLYNQMQRNPQVANDMRGVYNKLDQALENSSSGYRAANDTFRQQSGTIDAVDSGRNAASGRTRAADNIPAFNALSPEGQAAYRAGYADPHITRVESASMSPSTNKARPLITEKTGQEFPAFAAPGEADRLGNRIAREQRMFETSNAALGGSKSADNLADMDDAANFDPAILANLFSGNWKQAAMTGARQAMNVGRGLPPRAIEQIGRQLMETNPDAAAANFMRIAQKQGGRDRVRALIAASLLNGSTGGVTRLP